MLPVIKRVIFSALILVSLTGCQSVVEYSVRQLYGDSQFTSDAVKAAAIGMTAYDSFIQPRIEDYKHWPKPGTSACAAMKTTLLCRNEAVWQAMRKADAVASEAIDKANAVIQGVVPDDTGTALQDAAEAIHDSEAELLRSIPQVVP